MTAHLRRGEVAHHFDLLPRPVSLLSHASEQQPLRPWAAHLWQEEEEHALGHYIIRQEA